MKNQCKTKNPALVPLLLGTCVWALSIARASQAVELSISPSADSYVVQNSPGENLGTATILRVKSFLLRTDTGGEYPASYATGTTGNTPSYPQGALVDDVTTGSTGTLGVSVAGFRSAQAGHDYATLPLNPNAAGAYQAWSPFGSGSAHYDRLSDEDDATGVQITGSLTAMETEQPEDSTRTEPIASVTVYIRAKATGTGAGEKVAIVWRTHSGDYPSVISDSISRTSFSEYSGTKTKNPNTGQDWTWAEINALEVGVKGDTLGTGETIQVSKLWVVVNLPYNPDAEVYRDFSFGIPTPAVTIKGIEVVLSAYREGAVEGGIFGVRLSGDGGASWTDFKGTSALTQLDALYTLGSSSDLWGTSWSTTGFTDDNFRLEVVPEGGKAIPIAHNGYQWLLDSVCVKVYYEQNQNERSFLQFNLSSIPDGATITGAELKMTIETAPSESRDYEAYYVGDSWTETGINWGNQPSGGTLLDTQATGTVAETQGVWTGDTLRAQVESERFGAGADNTLSVMVKDLAEDSGTAYLTEFYSREAGEAAGTPVLVVTCTLPAQFHLFEWRPPVSNEGPAGGWETESTKPVKFLVRDENGGVVTSGVSVFVWIGESRSEFPAVLDDASLGQWKAEVVLVGEGSQEVTLEGNVAVPDNLRLWVLVRPKTNP